MRKTIALTLATAALIAGGTALAQDAQRPQRVERPAEMTRDAVEQRANAAFERLDVNKDGTIDAADREARVEQVARTRFDAADADGDGAISYDEFAALREVRKDRRTDRRATRVERQAARGEGLRGPAARGDRRGPGRGIARAMIGQDGSVSKADFIGDALSRFDAADADSDGVVTVEERRGAARENIRARRGLSG